RPWRARRFRFAGARCQRAVVASEPQRLAGVGCGNRLRSRGTRLCRSRIPCPTNARRTQSSMKAGLSSAPVERVRVDVFTIPTDFPESDGTIEWDSTTMVLVEVDAGGQTGLGYTYSHLVAAELIRS